jgi:hypothetical protein
MASGDQAQVGTDQPGPRTERDQTAGALAPSFARLGIGQRQVGDQLGIAVGRLGPLPSATSLQ